jgi:hypothetical protein
MQRVCTCARTLSAVGFIRLEIDTGPVTTTEAKKHFLPHEPQFVLLVERFTQIPSQYFRPLTRHIFDMPSVLTGPVEEVVLIV